MVVLMFAAYPASAQNLERLIMPGLLIEGHAEFENTCSKCHEPFKKTRQTELCAACHKKVAGDIDAAKGFHGRIRNIAGTDCASCHTDHKGRAADIVLMDKETFNHRRTDFNLTGAHANVSCASCHTAGKKHRDAPSQCIDCHRKNDPHQGRLGENCTDCHVGGNWHEVEFDHARRTKFVLSGRHKEVSCKQCHVDERYKNTPTKCSDCHRLNDVHRGQFGAECSKCHTADKWTQIRFEHDRDTRFKLHGRHREVRCSACHTSPLAGPKIRQDCLSCHENDDSHKGRNGPDCAACHTPERWKTIKFDHDRDTKFDLRGKHAGLRCESCHKGTLRKEKLGTRCYDCHRTEDVHNNRQEQRCERCHNERGWTEGVRFDHDLTRFPLIGQHAVVPCEECHVSQVFKGISRSCTVCHADQDTHGKRLGEKCETCHNPNGWTLWRFDHGAQTAFKLDGEHENLKCEACHTRPVENQFNISKICGECHRRDDVHRGAFGQSCERCHTAGSFKELRLER